MYENICLYNSLILTFPAWSFLPVEFYRRIVKRNECLALVKYLLNPPIIYIPIWQVGYSTLQKCGKSKVIPGPVACVGVCVCIYIYIYI